MGEVDSSTLLSLLSTERSRVSDVHLCVKLNKMCVCELLYTHRSVTRGEQLRFLSSVTVPETHTHMYRQATTINN